MHESVLMWGKKNLIKEEIEGKEVLEVGSLNINGSLREYVESLKPESYIGVDIMAGPGVDIICSAEQVVHEFGDNRFNLVICTEVLEHIENWKTAVDNIKWVCAEKGIILLTARSVGFPAHGYPDDWWRFHCVDLELIFSDCEFLKSEKDIQVPGAFIKVRKPKGFKLKNLRGIYIFSVKMNREISIL